MKLTKRLALTQLRINKRRTLWTLLGIVLATSMITAVAGFAYSGVAALYELLEGELRSVYYTTMYGIGAVLGTVIVAASVIVISNSFRVSAGERLSQFGILKSVGATKKQIAATIMYEGVFLSVIGIPVGLGVGLLVQFIGTQIASHYMEIVLHVQRDLPVFRMVIAWEALALAAVIAFFTVLLSAWLPARRAANIPAINAIRKSGEVTVRVKRVRASRVVRLFFGFEGTLASKTMKRNKRNFRATVVSLTISIALFIAASSFGTHLNSLARVVLNVVDADVIGHYAARIMGGITAVYADGTVRSQTPLTYRSIGNNEAEEIIARLREFPDVQVIAVGMNDSMWRSFWMPFPAEMLTAPMRSRYNVHAPDGYIRESFSMSVTLATVDAATYAELIRRAGVPHGSNLLLNHYRAQIDGIWTELVPFEFAEHTLTMTNHNRTEHDPAPEYTLITLHGELRGSDIPPEILQATRGSITIVVPELYAKSYRWFARTDAPHEFEEHMLAVFYEMLPDWRTVPWYRPGGEILVNVRNLVAEDNADRAIIRLVMIFTYGFVGMLTLIGLTNVISTISTNIRARAREFAVLQSVGMTPAGIRHMLNLESILSSVRSLIWGVPLGVLASYFVYLMIAESAVFAYQFPWVAVLQCSVAVFIITWATMRYSVSRLGGSIVETIREEK